MKPDARAIQAALSCGNRGCLCAKGRRLHCPAHADKDPDLNLTVRGDNVLLHCHAGCEQTAILAALRERKLWPEASANEPVPLPVKTAPAPLPQGTPAGARLEAEYDYGKAIKARFRLADGSKTFRLRLREGTYEEGLGDKVKIEDLPLYHQRDMEQRPDEPVYVCEGEKAADAAFQAGLLAVSFAGGAGQTQFGRALSLLAEREVSLWPDNDVPGWEFMTRLAEAIEERSGKRPGYVLVDLPRKGDAYDYFQAGGTILDLTEFVQPVVQHLGRDAWAVWVNSHAGPIEFLFEHAASSGLKGVECRLTVRPWTVKARGRVVKQRINFMSASAEEALVRKCRGLFKLLDGKDDADKVNWTEAINDAFSLAATAWGNRHDAVHADAIEPREREGGEWVVPGFVLDGHTSVVFGDGSAGKGYLAVDMAVAVASGDSWLERPCEPRRVLYVDWESDDQTFRRRYRRIKSGRGLPLSEPLPLWYMHADGVPLPELIEAIQDKVARHGIGLVIVDSAAPACGYEPEKSEHTIPFFNALGSLEGVAKLVVAHVTKGLDGPNKKAATKRPFGSVFWHNLARVTWYVEKSQRAGEDAIQQKLANRKQNEAALEPPVETVLEFEGWAGPAVLRVADEGAMAATLRERLAATLSGAGEPIPTGILATLVEASVDRVRVELNRQPEFVSLPGEGRERLWTLVDLVGGGLVEESA